MRASFRPICLSIACGLSSLLLMGCVNPRSRANERPAALRHLSPGDKALALGGNVRDGFSKDAVYIAWGTPNRTETIRMHGQTYEQWFYTHAEHGVTSGYFGVSRGFAYPADTGDGWSYRAGYYGTTDSFYAAPAYLRGFPPPETEVPYRKAVFARNVLIGYEPR